MRVRQFPVDTLSAQQLRLCSGWDYSGRFCPFPQKYPSPLHSVPLPLCQAHAKSPVQACRDMPLSALPHSLRFWLAFLMRVHALASAAQQSRGRNAPSHTRHQNHRPTRCAAGYLPSHLPPKTVFWRHALCVMPYLPDCFCVPLPPHAQVLLRCRF